LDSSVIGRLIVPVGGINRGDYFFRVATFKSLSSTAFFAD
jgi:hypothetical protein